MKKIVVFLLMGFLNASCQNKFNVEDAITDNTLKFPDNPTFIAPYYIVNNNYGLFQADETTRNIITIDSKSFRYPKYQQTDFFALGKNGVYFKGNLVVTDTTGFKFLAQMDNDFLWKTKQAVYKNQTELKGINASEFEWLLNDEGQSYGAYFKDKNNVYFYDKKVVGADVASAVSIDRDFFYDKNFLYRNDQIHTYKGEPLQHVNQYLAKTKSLVVSREEGKVQPQMDAKTIKSLSRFFSMDKNSIYFRNYKMPVAPAVFKNVKVWDQTNSAYLSDGNKLYRVYYESVALQPELDAKSFGMFPISDYYFDKDGIYGWIWLEKERKGIVKKFPFRYTDPVNSSNTSMTKNHSKYVFYKNQASDGIELYENLTPEEAQLVRTHKNFLVHIGNSVKLATPYDYKLYKADNAIYWDEKKTSADASTFETITGNYYKDKNYVYQYIREQGLIELGGIDVPTAHVSNGFLIDKNYIFHNNTRIIKSEEIELLAIFTGYRKGCGLDRTPGSNFYFFRNSDGFWLVKVSDTVSIRFLGKQFDSSWSPALTKFELVKK